MTWDNASTSGDTLTSDQRRICAHNIAACQAYKANPRIAGPPLSSFKREPPPARPQRDYKARPLKAPVRLTAIKPYPQSLIDPPTPKGN